MNARMPTYGRLELRGDRWVLSDVPPTIGIEHCGISDRHSELLPPAVRAVGTGPFKSYVYGLVFRKEGHRSDQRVRYVGMTANPLKRYRQHTSHADSHGLIKRVIAKHGTECFVMALLVIARGQTQGEADTLALREEVMEIAARHTTKWPHGLNQTIGGEGCGLVGAAKEKHRRSTQKKSPEKRAIYVAAAKRRMADPVKREIAHEALHSEESRRKRAASRREYYATHPEALLLQAERLAAVRRSPIGIQKNIDRLQSYREDPEMRERMRATMAAVHRTPEMRAKKSEIAAAQHQDPDFDRRYREGLAKRYADPKLRSEHGQKTRERFKSDPYFGRSSKIGIALRWAQTHLASGKTIDGAKQVENLRTLLVESWEDQPTDLLRRAKQFMASIDVDLFEIIDLSDESRITRLAEAFLATRTPLNDGDAK